MKITVCLQGREPIVKEYDRPVMIREIADEMQKEHPYRIVLARINRHEKPLTRILTYDGTLELLDIRDMSARMCYQTSLLLLYIKAVHDVAGRRKRRNPQAPALGDIGDGAAAQHRRAHRIRRDKRRSRLGGVVLRDFRRYCNINSDNRNHGNRTCGHI